ncbi:RNA-directed DNA polymerase, eukaryota, partial [Tanacetum coccineum]
NIRVNSFTMKMEILLEPTSNKLMVEHAEYDESNTYVLERFNTTAGNPVKKILLKLNLSDHRKLKEGGEVKEVQRSFRHSDTERLSRSDEVLKLKNFKKDATLKLSKLLRMLRLFITLGDRWCGWIQSCLRSSRGLVIVNGSPTSEFQFYRGLKQGDPLSPFLFILIMESLHISVQRVVDAGMFRGISMGPSLHLSHLFYANDAIFMGHWSDSNIDTIVQVLECFYRALGLRINMNKSKLIGISVANVIVDQAAAKIGCATLEALSLIKSSHPSIWLDIIREMEQLKHHSMDLIGFIHKNTEYMPWRLANVTDAVNCLMKMVGYSFRRITRGGIEQVEFLVFLASMEGVALVDMRDRWVWSLEDSGEFFVAYVRRLIDERWLPELERCFIRSLAGGMSILWRSLRMRNG